MSFSDIIFNIRSHVATEDDVDAAFKLFDSSTMDAARSGINEHINVTGEMAIEIKVRQRKYYSEFFIACQFFTNYIYFHMNSKQKPRSREEWALELAYQKED